MTVVVSLLLFSKNLWRGELVGGVGSGRSSTRLLVEHSLVIDLPLMMKRGWIKDAQCGRFGFRFVHNGENIRAYYDLRDPNDAWLELNYRESIHADMQPEVVQHIPLTFTQPHFGGRRWWMICSCDGRRVAKLYRPQCGNAFACREDWDLAYESQRQGRFDFTRLGPERAAVMGGTLGNIKDL